MMWRAIGQSVTGSSHISSGRGCEDALAYVIETLADGSEALICYVSDGAGSAAHAAEASQYTTQRALELTREALATGLPLIEGTMREIAEQLYDGLVAKAYAQDGHCPVRLADYIDADACLVGRAGPRRQDNAFRLQGQSLAGADLIIADHLRLCAQFPQEMEQIPGEAVVIVDQQDHSAPDILLYIDLISKAFSWHRMPTYRAE